MREFRSYCIEDNPRHWQLAKTKVIILTNQRTVSNE